MCRGQAYDGVSNMQGRRKGVATRFKQENPAAIALHCCAHSLNLCLQDAAKNLNCIRDALETVIEISTLIRYFPKRLHLFMTKLNSPESDSRAVTLKPLCATRWTARTPAIHAVITDYTLLLEILEEIHLTTKDEYGLKAGGLLHSLEKFSTLFGLELSYFLFSASEQVSLTLQTKLLLCMMHFLLLMPLKIFSKGLGVMKHLINFTRSWFPLLGSTVLVNLNYHDKNDIQFIMKIVAIHMSLLHQFLIIIKSFLTLLICYCYMEN